MRSRTSRRPGSSSTPDVARPPALDRRFHWWCLAPTLAVLAVVPLLPPLYLLATSLTPLNLTQPRTAWDFSQPGRNYTFLTADGRLHGSFWVQLKLSAWTVGLQMILCFLFALLLKLLSRFLEYLCTRILGPLMLPPIVV